MAAKSTILTALGAGGIGVIAWSIFAANRGDDLYVRVGMAGASLLLFCIFEGLKGLDR